MDCEASWKAFDAEVYFPFHLLTIIFMLYDLLIFILRIWINRIRIDIYTLVHSSNEVVNDLHHFSCVATQVQALHRS